MTLHLRCVMAAVLVLSALLTVVSGSFSDDGSGVMHVKIHENDDVFKADFVQATFGPGLSSDDDFMGRLYITDPPDACSKLSPIRFPVSDEYQPIALIVRRHCNFELKVLYAQQAGFKAAVIYDNTPGEPPFAMAWSNATIANQVNISSVLISNSDGIAINGSYSCQPLQQCRYFVRLQVITRFLDPSTILIPMAVAFACILFITVAVVVGRWIREVRRQRKSRVSKSQLKKIPSRKFKKGDTYDACAICLDDYNEGDKIRILPCSHAYHIKCIDPWLLKNKRTCPVCKRTAVPGDSNSDDSESAESSRRRTAEPTERTPLLPPPAGSRIVADSAASPAVSAPTAGQPAGDQPALSRFYGSGLPVAFENEVTLENSSGDECDDVVGSTDRDVCLLLSSRSSSRATGRGLSCEVSIGSASINADPASASDTPATAATSSDQSESKAVVV